jgi:2-polyprenyl-3-methyl-5-hydroxy-6-metoxy-1,4-benzoquinol methylase
MNTKEKHKYDYGIDPSSETAAAHVIRMVGQKKRVLEVGCGPGSITKILARQGQCRVTGLEYDLEAIEKVTPYCEKIMQADLNCGEWPRLLDGAERFDVVVAADVLEHLYDPWTTLREMISFINPTGYLVISLPHVGHAAVVSCLINGNFEYRDRGLLDHTHIRFFGLKNIEALFAQANLKIIEAKYVFKSPERTEFAASWSKLSRTMQYTLKRNVHADVYQVVVKAVPLSYPGDSVLLVPSKPRRTVATSLASWKMRIGRRLSSQVKQDIRKNLGQLGIHL